MANTRFEDVPLWQILYQLPKGRAINILGEKMREAEMESHGSRLFARNPTRKELKNFRQKMEEFAGVQITENEDGNYTIYKPKEKFTPWK